MKQLLYRVLAPDELWSRPWYYPPWGESIRTRERCQGAPGQAPNACPAGATVAVGRRKVCRTHLRIMAQQQGAQLVKQPQLPAKPRRVRL